MINLKNATRGIDITGFPSTVPDQICCIRASSIFGNSFRTNSTL
jgi:hypothetical protein